MRSFYAAVLVLTLAGCGESDPVGTGDDAGGELDAGLRPDADPLAPDAAADAAQGALDAGVDAGAPDAAGCGALPCYGYTCDPVANTGCPFGGGCYVACTGFQGSSCTGWETYCAEPGTKTMDQSCSDFGGDSFGCAGGYMCLHDDNSGIPHCHKVCHYAAGECSCIDLDKPAVIDTEHYGVCN